MAHTFKLNLKTFLKTAGNNGRPLSQETNKKVYNLARRYNEHFVSLEEAQQLASLAIPDHDLALIRDRAAAVFMLLAGTRAGAMLTLPIKAIDLENWTVRQLTKLGVKTKNSKSATTFMLKIEELLPAVQAWDTIVRNQLPDDSLWYAPIDQKWGEQHLTDRAPGYNRVGNFNKRLRKLFKLANLPYKSSHAFRHGYAVIGLLQSKSMAQLQAVSRNLLHSDISITDRIYGQLSEAVRKELTHGLFSQTVQNSLGTNVNLNNVSEAQLGYAFKAALSILAAAPAPA